MTPEIIKRMQQTAEAHRNRPIDEIIEDNTPKPQRLAGIAARAASQPPRFQPTAPPTWNSVPIDNTDWTLYNSPEVPDENPWYQPSYEQIAGNVREVAARFFPYHDGRNKLNTGLESTEPTNDDGPWVKLTAKKSILHQIGEAAAANKKWVGPEGHREAVYDANQNLVLNSTNQGTYNYYDPNQDPIRHGLYDVAPYLLLGNSPEDPTTLMERTWQLRKYLESNPNGQVD